LAIDNENEVTGWKLKAFKYYYIPWKDIGLGGIVVEPTDDLLRVQQELMDAVAPFTEKTGTAAAFVTAPEGLRSTSRPSTTSRRSSQRQPARSSIRTSPSA
jgi:hypothetical protein